MSYESKILQQLKMPSRKQVEQVLLRVLLKHGGVIKEFGSGQDVVDEIANEFKLDEIQRTAYLKTIYHEENRIKKAYVWHRLLFRAADSLSKEKYVSRPTLTYQLTNKKEWMLTESGLDEALKLSNIPPQKKAILPIKSFEVQKIVNRIKELPRPDNYEPFDKEKKSIKVTRETILRTRGFRQAVIEAYCYRCAVCGMKLNTPDSLSWEVEAAHIVPHSAQGRDDLLNGLALCHMHHWAFDVGWYTLQNDYTIKISPKVHSLPPDFGMFGEYSFLRELLNKCIKIYLPKRAGLHPHHNAILWHQQNVFHK